MSNLFAKLQELKQNNETIINPFSNVTYGNFWLEKSQDTENVNSIHHQAIDRIESELNSLKEDNTRKIRTVLMTGDSGCGKSNLLGRLKKKFNDRAYFIYIQPIEDRNYIWRHTLQYTVKSLMQIPEGEKDSQIGLWLKGLPIFNNDNWIKLILGEKKAFIRDLKNAYPSGIYEAKKFFGVLYELANNNYDLGCEWLAGEDLDEEDLATLGVNKSIDSEKMARGILSNFGRIADATKPIILCFDQIERAYESVFDLNTTFHNEFFTNFIIIISVVRENWEDYKKRMIQSDLARINQPYIVLKNITLEEAEKLWESRLKAFYHHYNITPSYSIEPLRKEDLKQESPRNNINLRNALNLGGILFQKYLDKIFKNGGITPPPPIKDNEFIEIWSQTLESLPDKIQELMDYSDVEFLAMLKTVLQALSVNNINPKFLNGVTKDFSLTYESLINGQKKGLIWCNTPQSQRFCAVMKECDEVTKKKICDQLYLIRNRVVGKAGSKGYEIYQSLFKPVDNFYIHYKPNVDDFRYLIAYYQLAKKAYSGDLIVEFKPTSLKELYRLTKEYNILKDCKLLNKIGIITG